MSIVVYLLGSGVQSMTVFRDDAEPGVGVAVAPGGGRFGVDIIFVGRGALARDGRSRLSCYPLKLAL